ncbi:MAG: PorV/PorQ family protein [Rubricoccaceae bacterium]|nr:PorV/PorQ family protein [Rubricoccaceae bacterium]
MRSRLLTYSAAAAFLLGIGSPAVQAQGDDRAGTAAMEELLVPITPRTVALGSALTSGLSTISGVEALQSNPAALMVNPTTNAMFSRTEYLADIGINYFGIAQNFGSNNIALTISNWDYGDIPLQTENDPEITAGLTYDASTTVVGLSYARQFTDRIAAGITAKALNRSIFTVNSTGVAFDAGMTYVVGETGLRFGVSLKNFGPQMGFDGLGLDDSADSDGPSGDFDVPVQIRDLESELPSLLNFGAAYTRQFAGDLSASVMANFRSNAYDLDQYAAGVELGYMDLIYARAGVNLTADTDMSAWEVWNVGAGLNLDMVGNGLAIDYAYRPSDVFGGVNVFSVGFTL